MDKADTSVVAFFMYPAKRTKIALYQNSKLLKQAIHNVNKKNQMKRKKSSIAELHSKRKWTYQSITPEDIESFIIGTKSVKAAEVNPFHVLGHHPPVMYVIVPIMIDQLAMIIALIAPGIPQFSFITKIHDKST